MLREGKAEFVFVFHDDIKSSKGTKDMINQAIERKVPVKLFYHGNMEGAQVVSKIE